ncbi:MAG: lysophospholipid acyltransferase family protein [bacterium]
MRSLYWVFRFFFQVFYKLFFRYRVLGRENVPREGGVLIAANHLSYLDPPLVGAALSRRATYMAEKGLFFLPLIGTFVASFSFSVDRESPKPSTIKEAVARLRRGELVVMFPEGTRRATGDFIDAKRGIATIASLSRATIVPTLIEGTDRALPVGAKFIRPARVTITFGAPIMKPDHETEKEFQQRIATGIMEEIKRLKRPDPFHSMK